VLPEFNEAGDLPVGVYRVTLREVLDRFGLANQRRREIGRRLERIWRLAASTGGVDEFVLFGSFITEKPEPNDVDVILIVKDDFTTKNVSGDARLLFEHGTAQTSLGASIFWYPRSAALLPGSLEVERWQIKRDRTRRGIIVVTTE
jgi:hypothetical protein